MNADAAISTPLDGEKDAPDTSAGFWSRVDAVLDWCGDRLNPLLVKETRQALKSKQFIVTFSLVLGCVWFWSMFGIAMMGTDAFYGASGADMFFGYICVLAFPLTVVVPFSAFRSLAAEREDRTYELLAITTLTSRKVIAGKLGSAIVQMLVYFSAIVPCLAFTYLLRGIDILVIAMILFYYFFTSLALAMIALFVATLTEQRHWQIALSVLLVAGLMFVFFGSLGLTTQLAYEVWPFSEWEFWAANAGMLTAYVGYFALIFLAAAAQLTFAAENRSTALRCVMLLHQMAWAGWMFWVAFAVAPGGRYSPGLIVFSLGLSAHWFLMGAMMAGESPHLSPRVQRNLPQTFLGRMFFTWFHPGPGTGFGFALTSLATGIGLGALLLIARSANETGNLSALLFLDTATGSQIDHVMALAGSIVAVSHVGIYLGLGRFLVRFVRKFTEPSILISLLLHVVLVAVGTAAPLTIQWTLYPNDYGYSAWQLFNPFWTLGELFSRWQGNAHVPLMLTVLPLLAVGLTLAQLPGLFKELHYVRIPKPLRVSEEDEELHKRRHPPPPPTKKNPWDDE